jgi:SAM-dependent methyltransferase
VSEVTRAYETLFDGVTRMGPGSDAISGAIASWVRADSAQRILEVGAGHGATARALLARTEGCVIASDRNETFVRRTRAALPPDRTGTCVADLLQLPIAPDSVDAVVAEGCLYATGLRRSLSPLRSVLRMGGRLALTHFGWTRTRVPTPMRTFWEQGLPERFVRGEAYMVLLEHEGFRALHLEPFPRGAWGAYYEALRARLDALETAGTASGVPRAVLDQTREEIRMFENGGLDFYAYFLLIGERVR